MVTEAKLLIGIDNLMGDNYNPVQETELLTFLNSAGFNTGITS